VDRLQLVKHALAPGGSRYDRIAEAMLGG